MSAGFPAGRASRSGIGSTAASSCAAPTSKAIRIRSTSEAIRLRVGTDFDQVVLGIPVGALAPICGELMERDERFRRGIESARTVRTQAFQLWLKTEQCSELGWAYGENSVTGCYVEPLDTYCDMTHLIPREAWDPGASVRSIAYFCGVLDESPRRETQMMPRRRVRAQRGRVPEPRLGGPLAVRVQQARRRL